MADDVYGSREVSIVAPYDSTVSAVVLEESLPAWLSAGWRIGTADAPAQEQAPAPDQTTAQAAPAPAPAPDATAVKK